MSNFFDFTNNDNSPVVLESCNSSIKNKLFKDTIDTYHSYVKFKSIPSRRLSYLVYESKSGNLIGAVGISSAVIAVACIDKYIGWDSKTKMRNLNKVANNSRFCLIQSNITIKNTGSMALKQLRIIGAKDWKARYGDELILLETFVQPERDLAYNTQMTRNGSVYLSDNWIEIGMTSGSSIQKSPLKLWAKEDGERGRLAREDKAECLKRYAQYMDGHNNSGYKVTKSKKKIVFIKPLVYNWKIKLTT
jgi:hypothetical protein